MAFRTTSIDQLSPIAVAGVHWLPLRHTLDVRAFGVNGYTADAGEDVIEDHDEMGSDHEEMYVVLRGRARFTLDGEPLDAPAGTIVFLPDPPTRRHAVAEEDGTTVLAVGGKRGEGYDVSAWEWRFRAAPHEHAGELERAEAILREGLDANPGDGGTLYNLACVEARAGRPDEAIAHLRSALTARPGVREWAADDRDLDSLRERADWPL
jgi:tetratricopeptide (TPR) repeat protein